MALAVFAAALVAGGLPARDDSFDDATFLKKAIMGGMQEVKLGKLASEKGTDAAVRKFGQRMMKDHTAANKKLMTLAGTLRAEAPTKLDTTHQKEFDRFAAMEGKAFDNAYARHMVEDHEKDLKEFEKASKNAKSKELRELATDLLPTLREHLKMAKDLPGGTR
jgi:putative membrane protein